MIQKMNLSEVLRWQKRVVMIIRKIEGRIHLCNSAMKGTEKEFSARKLMEQRTKWVKHLIDVKLSKMKTSFPIQEHIFKLAETKAEISFLERIPITHGAQHGYGNEKPIEWEAEIRNRERDLLVTQLQSQIDQLQKHIDAFNFATTIQLEVPQEED